MLVAFTYLPGFVTMVFRGMPTVWRGRHRLIFCWLIFMQAVHPGRKTLEEMARWTPATITAWRFGRLLKAAYWNVQLLVSWLAQDLVATLPAPANGILYLFGAGTPLGLCLCDRPYLEDCGGESAQNSCDPCASKILPMHPGAERAWEERPQTVLDI